MYQTLSKIFHVGLFTSVIMANDLKGIVRHGNYNNTLLKGVELLITSLVYHTDRETVAMYLDIHSNHLSPYLFVHVFNRYHIYGEKGI